MPEMPPGPLKEAAGSACHCLYLNVGSSDGVPGDGAAVTGSVSGRASAGAGGAAVGAEGPPGAQTGHHSQSPEPRWGPTAVELRLGPERECGAAGRPPSRGAGPALGPRALQLSACGDSARHNDRAWLTFREFGKEAQTAAGPSCCCTGDLAWPETGGSGAGWLQHLHIRSFL